MEPRLAPLDPPYPEPLDALLRSMVPPGVEPLKLFRTLAHNPRVLGRIRDANLLDRGSIRRRDREIVILRTCARCGAEYEWGVHVSVFASRVGLSPEEVEGTLPGRESRGAWSDRDALLLALVDSLNERSEVDEQVWKGLEAHFESDQLVELVVLVGFYHAISFVVRALGVEHEEGAARFPGPGREGA